MTDSAQAWMVIGVGYGHWKHGVPDYARLRRA